MLKELCALMGVSGNEGEVRDYIREAIRKDARDIIEDAYGNLIVRKGKTKKPRIMLASHMDEVGIMITSIDKDGFLRFRAIGITTQVLLAKRMVIGKNKITGVIGQKPVHLTKDTEIEKLPEIKDLFIDIGAASKEEASKIIEIGSYGTFDTEYREQGDAIFGKAFDNRLGCYILIQLLKKTGLPVHYAFTVQEEAGLRGARIAAHRIMPQVAIAIDTTASAEWPSDKDLPQYPQIGKGPVITITDRSIICDEKLVSILIETAKDNNISYQLKQPMIGGTDAGAIHLAGEGTRSAVMSIAARYIHSPLSIASKNDLQNGVRLLSLALENILKKEKLWN